MKLSDVVDTARYPILDPSSKEREALATRYRAELDKNQFCSLPHFMLPSARAKAISDAKSVLTEAFHNNAERNCYLHRQRDSALPSEHPRNMMFRSSARMVAYDQIPASSPLLTLYHADEFRRFIADIVDEHELYDSADPFQPVNVVCYRPGDQSAWHFDSDNAFTMTLMLQASDAGGDFQVVPNTRSDTDQRYDRVAEFLRGERPDEVVNVPRDNGALCLFRGCNSLHRVTPVTGDTMRMMAVFVYEKAPGVVGDHRVNSTIYGPRVAGLLEGSAMREVR